MLKYSLQPNPFPNSLSLDLATIPAGTKIYAYYEPFVASQAPYQFFDNGVKVGNNESQQPIEVGNGNGWTPAAGSHKLEVKDKNLNILETVNFTVGIVTPPPTGKKTIIFTLKSDGSELMRATYDEEQVKVIIPV